MVSFLNQIKILIKKEFRQEFRQKFAIAGILLYICSTIFVCYLSFKRIIHPPTWNALFWIILLFASVNAAAKSFIQESRGRQLYYYVAADPAAVILAKTIYNVMLLNVLSFTSLFLYSIFIKNPVQDMTYFMFTLFLGSVGFAAVLTMVSAIAAKSSGNFSLMAILSFPLLIPMLLTLIKLSSYSIDGLDRTLSYPYFGVLGLLILLVGTLSFVLFPYLWRE